MNLDLLSALDFRALLLDNYKKMNINEQELVVILMMEHLLKQKNHILTADLMAIKMTIPSKEIDKILSALVKKNIIDLDISKKSQAMMSLTPLKIKLINILKQSLLEEMTEVDEKYLGNIYQLLEKELCRTLSPMELSRIQEWFMMSYTEDMIKNAIKDMKKDRKLSIRGIDEILLQRSKSEEIASEGYSTKSDRWNKNIAETIAITKTQWLNKDEE